MTQDSGLSTVDFPLSTILVTGGCGFIGTNLVKYLSNKGYRVRILDNLSTPSRKFLNQESPVTSPLPSQAVDSELSSTDLVVGDIRDYQAVKKVTEGVGAVVHLAAHTSVVESVEKPKEDWDINVNGTLNLMEAGQFSRAILNTLASVVLCIGAAALGVMLARQL